MSRKAKPGSSRSVTVHFPEEFAYALDEYVVGLGLEGRAAGLIMLAKAGMSSVPLDSAIGTAMMQAVNSVKRTEFEELAKHFEARARIYRDAIS